MKVSIAILAIAVVAGGVGGRTARAGADIKVGYVDLQRCLGEIDEGKKAKAKLKRIFDRKQKSLNDKQKELKRFEDELRKDNVILKEEAKRKKYEEYMVKRQELMQYYMTLQKDLAKQEADVTKPILGKLSKILNGIGKEQAFTFILEKTDSGLVFAQPHLDLSNELIRRYNEKFGK